MSSKLTSLFCVLFCLFAGSYCEESSSMIRKVTDVQDLGYLRKTTRIRPPSSYLMKIKSFSLLAKAGNKEKYESAVFKAGGQKWKLALYPNGNKKAGGDGHISLYLEIQRSNLMSKSNNWEVYADVKFFVYNQSEDKYLTLQEAEPKRFNVAQTEVGLAKVLPLSTFKDSKNGYLVNDKCVFGTEVYVTEPTKNWEEFYSIKPGFATYTWNVVNFSKLDKEQYYSEGFTAAGVVWKLRLFPIGDPLVTKHDWMSLYLEEFGYEKPSQPRNATIANFKLRVLNQTGGSNAVLEITGELGPPTYGFGKRQFVRVADLLNPSKGFLVKDTLLVEAQILEVSKTTYLP